MQKNLSSWIFNWFQRFFNFKKPVESISSTNFQPKVVSATLKSNPIQIDSVKISVENLKPQQTMNFVSVAKFATNLSTLSKHRAPLIKFLGPRFPRPHFDSSKLPPIPRGSIASSSSTSSSAQVSSIGKIGTTPRGSGIEESALPKRFGRRPIDEEEIAAINNGGAYGL